MGKLAFAIALRFALFVERLSAALTRIVLTTPSEQVFDDVCSTLARGQPEGSEGTKNE